MTEASSKSLCCGMEGVEGAAAGFRAALAFRCPAQCRECLHRPVCHWWSHARYALTLSRVCLFFLSARFLSPVQSSSGFLACANCCIGARTGTKPPCCSFRAMSVSLSIDRLELGLYEVSFLCIWLTPLFKGFDMVSLYLMLSSCLA